MLVMDTASKVNLDLPAAEVACKSYEQAVKDGRGEEDFSAVVKVLRK
jgi:3-hydroxyisobutyrate dehydrogenase/2-hydroxy-3-oxopropionate reductase